MFSVSWNVHDLFVSRFQVDFTYATATCMSALTTINTSVSIRMAEEDEHKIVFNDILPLLFRVVLLIQLGIFLWHRLVWICYKLYNMNVMALLNLAYSPHKYAADDHCVDGALGEFPTTSAADFAENQILLRGIYGTLSASFPVNVTAIIIYWTLLAFGNDSSLPIHVARSYIPLLLLAYTLYKTFGPGSTMGQTRMYTTLKRVLKGNINSSTMRTNDILISDSLTSYAKVVNDLGSYLWVSLLPGNAPYNIYIEALVLSLPGLMRIKQCWFESKLTGQKQHLFNMIKYCSQLGPIFINLLIKIQMNQLTDDATASARLNSLNFWWYILSFFSSTYCFIWDIRMDWGFGLFEPMFTQLYGNFSPLRPPRSLVYKNYLGYYSLILIDFVLRFIWVLKIYVIKEKEVELGVRHRVGSFLFGYDCYSFGFVVLEVLEIVRRWFWCLLKLESDLVKLQARDDITHAIPLASIKT